MNSEIGKPKRKRGWGIAAAVGLAFPTVLFAFYGTHIEVGENNNTIAAADLSGVVGAYNDVTDSRYSLAVGQGHEVGEPSHPSSFGYGNLAAGRWNDIDADESFVSGRYNQVLADYSGAVGTYLIVDDRESFAVGTYNDTAALTSDAAFVVGNGTGSSAKSNALVVYHNGDVYVPKRQGDVLMGEFGH